MEHIEPERAFTFHIEGPVASQHTVPAAVLVQILENAQRAFELIGLHVEGKAVKERARVPASIVGKFQLVCSLPVHGCYAVPVTVGSDVHDLFSPAQAEKATHIFKDLMRALHVRDPGQLQAALPDSEIRRRVLSSVKGMLPQGGASWRLDIYDGGQNVFARLDDLALPFLQDILVTPQARETSQTVTGWLSAVEFSARKLTIIYPVTNREMDCFYDESLEDLLYENRRELIQVTGSMVLDAQGVPKKIVNVTDIRDLDLSPFVVERVVQGGLTLKVKQPIELRLGQDETLQLLELRDERLGLHVFAETRESLHTELNEQFAMLWGEYACASDDELDEPARELKSALLDVFEVVHAA